MVKKRSDRSSFNNRSSIAERDLFTQKKAQLTMFFIIGILLIAVFAFMWYLNSTLTDAQLKAPTEKMIADLLKTGSIPYYVGVCLEEISEDGIYIAGQQGGDIFVDQGGPAPNPTKFIPLGHRVTYGISSPFLVEDTIYPPPPGYPGGKDYTLQTPLLNFQTWGRFGEVSLRKLCDSKGANSPLEFDPSGETISAPICQNNIYTDTLSTQWQLEQYVSKLVVNCTNWTAIAEATGYNITATGDPNITVRLGLNDVWIDAYIPLEIKVGGVAPVYTIGDFHKRLPVRLKRVVELASFMSTYDSYLLGFNLSSGFKYFDSVWDTNMNVSITTPLKTAGIWEDVITIEDSASLINGKNFVFRFARQNRYPALDWIHQMTNWSDFDIVVMENDTIYLNPNPAIDNLIYDPDEDSLTYYYTGWKETCDEVFNFEFGIPNLECSRKEPSSPDVYFDFPNNGIDLSSEWMLHPAWKSLELWSVERANGLINDNEAYPIDAPRAWTSSDEFVDSQKNATFIPHHNDIGPHNVTIWVCDEAGLCDYQIIRVMVFDFPQLQLNGTNPYDDIPYDRASVEDFYRLSTEGTTAYYTPLLGYIFNDTIDPFEIRIDHPLQILDLPVAEFGYERDIRFIWNFSFLRESHCAAGGCDIDPMIEHQINLTIPLIEVPPKIFNISVYQCLPHRNSLHPEAEMWPYNTSDTDPYLASHSCCSIGNEYNITIEKTDLIVSDTENGGSYYIAYNEYGNDYDVKVYDADNDEPITNTDSTSDVFTHSPDSDGRIKIVFLNAGLLPQDMIISISNNLNDLPPWGSWLDSGNTCHGGIPVIGPLFTMQLFDEENPYVGDTILSYTGVSAQGGGSGVDIPDSWRNDVITMLFTRYCSGDRGNICSGEADKKLYPIGKCEDMKSDIGEIESCQGPEEWFVNEGTKQLTPCGSSCSNDAECTDCLLPSTGKCIYGQCYENIGQLTCDKYDDTTFEQVFNLPRLKDGSPATGVCNEFQACSDNENIYDSTLETGQFKMEGATCEGGSCSKPIEVKDCWDYNGFKNDLTNRFCEYSTTDGFYTSQFICNTIPDSLAGQLAICEMDTGARVDPDDSPEACTSCKEGGPNAMEGDWTDNGGQLECCGDDLGEGGHRYGDTIQGTPIPPANNVPGAGDFQDGRETTCNDYIEGYGPSNIAGWIDNDCDGDANCEDSSCKLRAGPNGGWCCKTPTDCKQKLNEDNTQYVGCGTNEAPLECDCLDTQATNSPTSYDNPYDTVTLGSEPIILTPTCVSAGAYDKYIKINYDGDFEAEAIEWIDLDAKGENTCIGDVEARIEIDAQNKFIIYESGSTKDCLVTIKITPT